MLSTTRAHGGALRPNCPRILPKIQGIALTCNIPMDHIPGTPDWRCPLCEHIVHDEALFNLINGG